MLNEFSKMRKTVQEAVGNYDRIRKECEIVDEWHTKTIHRLAKPFLNGYFTLAVVGKMSSGKSTFINSLIGEDILPTGHFQTTSTITYIERGPKLLMEVVFCDGHKETITEDIKEKLRSLVSVPDEYSDLPINDINKLISGGDNEIEILKKKEGIEEMRKCACADKSVWRKYIKEHTRKNIAQKVYIQCPLSDEFDGWRIVDTPGVGAVWGIQDETKQLFFEKDNDGNKIVDAIIFLHSGTDNIEDESAHNFMEQVSKELTEDAKQRLFFVLTKASEQRFRSNKDKILDRAKKLYAEKFKIPKERFTYVDSLLYRFCNEIQDKENFGDLPTKDGWTDADWEAMTILEKPIQKAIKEKGEELNNESINKIMNEWANFNTLKSAIDDFVCNEKKDLLQKIKYYINIDCLGFIQDFQKQKNLLEGGKEMIEKEKEKVQERKIEYNNILNKLQREAQPGQIWKEFEFIDEKINSFSPMSEISEIQTAYLNLDNEVKNRRKGFFKEIENDFHDYCKCTSSEDISLQKIDFEDLVKEAEQKSQVEDKSKFEEVPDIEKGKKGFFSPAYKKKRIYPYKKTDLGKKRREFAALVIKEARNRKKVFKEELESTVNDLLNGIKQEVENNLNGAQKRLNDLESQIGDKKSVIKKLNRKIKIIKDYE